MIDNIDEILRQAQIAKDKDDMVKHAEKTRQASKAWTSFSPLPYIFRKSFVSSIAILKPPNFCFYFVSSV